MVRRVLMVAFHFPPQRGSSGVQRTLKFARYLPDSGWEPLVLTAHPRAHAQTGADQMAEIPPGLVVRRAFALDTSRHLSFRGRYLRAMSVPDRWISWVAGAVPAGLAMILRYRPQVIWSTYPVASANLVALALHRLTGIPWVADLRDPMIDATYPADRWTRRAHRWIEARTVRSCASLVCTTPGAVRTYRERYPDVDPSRFVLVENGYDEENFAGATARSRADDRPGRFVLLHSGIIYPSERDPVPLFAALESLVADGRLPAGSFQLVLRAAVHEEFLRELASRYGLDEIVSVEPHIPYAEALGEMLAADGLLLLQAANCNDQVPAKLYEYFRAGRPILALTDPAGDTALTLRNAGVDSIAPLDDSAAIAAALLLFLERCAAGNAPRPASEAILSASRRGRTAALADVLDVVAKRR